MRPSPSGGWEAWKTWNDWRREGEGRLSLCEGEIGVLYGGLVKGEGKWWIG